MYFMDILLFPVYKQYIIIIIISVLEPVFLYRGLGFLQVFLEDVLSTQSDSEGQQIPYLASFCHSFTSSHDFLGLPDLFCATTFSLRTSEIQPVLRSTCPNHLILPVRSTTSKSWMPSFVRRESELTSSFALTLQIQRIMVGHYAGDGSVYPPSWPKSLLHVASHSSHMMSTPYLWSEGALGGW